jgi:AcrR family transcriptional regulator
MPAPHLRTPPDRRRRRSAELRIRLFRAALDLFAKKGFAETTVEDITSAADVGKGTFFNYFPSKDHLLVAFGDMQMEKLQTLVAEATETGISMPAFLRTLGVRMTEEPARNPSIVRAILQGNLSSSPVREAMRKNHLRGQELLSRLIKLGQDRGEIRADLTAGKIAQVFRQAVFGTLLIWAVTGEGSLPERIHASFDLLWNGIAPRSANGSAGGVTPDDHSS